MMQLIKIRILSRILGWKVFLQGDISFNQAFQMMLPISMRSEEAEMLREIVVMNQYHIELINSDDVVIDAGANIGIFSVWVAKNYPHVAVYAFEPSPSTFIKLLENIKPYPKIKAFNFALGEIEKKSSIITVAGNSGGNYIGEGGDFVEMKTIDGFHIPANFIKMDTEGYEGAILRGGAETIKKYRPIIAMSAYHKPDDKMELPAILNSIAPYDCVLHHDCEEDFICKPAGEAMVKGV